MSEFLSQSDSLHTEIVLCFIMRFLFVHLDLLGQSVQFLHVSLVDNLRYVLFRLHNCKLFNILLLHFFVLSVSNTLR